MMCQGKSFSYCKSSFAAFTFHSKRSTLIGGVTGGRFSKFPRYIDDAHFFKVNHLDWTVVNSIRFRFLTLNPYRLKRLSDKSALPDHEVPSAHQALP